MHQETKDISEIIEEEALALESGDGTGDDDLGVADGAAGEDGDAEPEDASADSDKEPENEKEDADEDGEPEQVDDEAALKKDEEPAAIEAPQHWEESIREAFSKADPLTQQVWLEQQKEFQRGFNNVSQEAAQLRRYQQEHIGVQGILDQVIPAWQAQGMNAEQGLGQLVQLGMAYASNPQQTLIHLAEMAGLDLNTLGEEAPYRTSDDIARDNRMQALEARLAEQDRNALEAEQTKLESDINAFQAETDADGNLAHPYFEDHMDDVAALFRKGFNGSLNEAYEYLVLNTPELRSKVNNYRSKDRVSNLDKQRNSAARKAVNASNQRVKKSRPAPNLNAETDDLSVDDLVALQARKLEAAG